jgi:hypothetical protein
VYLSRLPKKRVSSQVSIQAPTGGLNARDPIADMKETEALRMENYFPMPNQVVSRNGDVLHASGLGGAVDTVMAYNNGSNRKLFGASSGNIFDVTNSGPVGSAVVTGMNNSRYQYVNFGTAGGYFLLAVNNFDKMRVFNGTSWYADGTTTTVTGFDTSNAAHISSFKNRVWFIQRDSFLAWYLPVSSIGGAANSLDLSGLFKMGGYLMAMANWTIDNAAGVDDYAAFITSEGEVALYKGTDPSSAATWALVGTFRMGRPIGRRCFCKAGADVLVLTTDGAFPLSKALLTDRSQTSLAATDKISNLVAQDIVLYKDNFGWQPIIHPAGRKLIINVPTTEEFQSYQYVMNTTHGAWCTFTGWNAFCWETLGDDLYYGGTGAVYRADTGGSDHGNSITGVTQQAFSYFGAKGIQKIFKMARPIMVSEGSVIPALLMNVDFEEQRTTAPTYTIGTSGAEWNVAEWNVAEWVTGNNLTKYWQSVSGVGISGGLRLVTELKDVSCQWISTDVVYEKGGTL